jgi:hypothetical protein
VETYFIIGYVENYLIIQYFFELSQAILPGMEKLGKNQADFLKKIKPKKDPHLHSPAHLLADELSVKLSDKKHFGYYLKMAVLYDHNVLRQVLGQVLESNNLKTPGKLFAYLLKKQVDAAKVFKSKE